MGTPMEGESKLAAAAEIQVTRLIKAKAAPKWLPLVLALIMIMMVPGTILLALAVSSTHTTQVQQRAQQIQLTQVVAAQRRASIVSCQQSNERAKGVIKALDELVTLLEGPNPTAKVQAEAKKYEDYVASVNAPRDCVKAYSVGPQPQAKAVAQANFPG